MWNVLRGAQEMMWETLSMLQTILIGQKSLGYQSEWCGSGLLLHRDFCYLQMPTCTYSYMCTHTHVNTHSYDTPPHAGNFRGHGDWYPTALSHNERIHFTSLQQRALVQTRTVVSMGSRRLAKPSKPLFLLISSSSSQLSLFFLNPGWTWSFLVLMWWEGTPSLLLLASWEREGRSTWPSNIVIMPPPYGWVPSVKWGTNSQCRWAETFGTALPPPGRWVICCWLVEVLGSTRCSRCYNTTCGCCSHQGVQAHKAITWELFSYCTLLRLQVSFCLR